MSLEALSPVLFESVSNVTATNSVELGTRAKDSNGYEYVYCYNAGNSQISPGFGGIVVTGTSGYSVTITSVADGVHRFAGVCKHNTLTTATYGWLMYNGYANVESAADSTLTGGLYLALKADGTFNNIKSAQTGVLQERCVGISDDGADTASAGSFLAKIFSPTL